MIETPHVVETAEQLTANLHITVPRERIREVMGPGIKEVHSAIAAQGLVPAGPWFTHHFQTPNETFDFDICIPVGSTLKPVGEVRPGQWPAMKVVRTVYRGPYEQLIDGWSEFRTWLDSQNCKTAPDIWERYLVDPGSNPDPSAWRTELNLQLLD
jgi:effector-binding domain-containing protein